MAYASLRNVTEAKAVPHINCGSIKLWSAALLDGPRSSIECCLHLTNLFIYAVVLIEKTCSADWQRFLKQAANTQRYRCSNALGYKVWLYGLQYTVYLHALSDDALLRCSLLDFLEVEYTLGRVVDSQYFPPLFFGRQPFPDHDD